MTESLIDRPLTDLQRETLRCVAEGRCRSGHVRVGSQHFETWFAYGRAANSQITALRKRRFIGYRQGQLALTLAGVFELFFDVKPIEDSCDVCYMRRVGLHYSGYGVVHPHRCFRCNW